MGEAAIRLRTSNVSLGPRPDPAFLRAAALVLKGTPDTAADSRSGRACTRPISRTPSCQQGQLSEQSPFPNWGAQLARMSGKGNIHAQPQSIPPSTDPN